MGVSSSPAPGALMPPARSALCFWELAAQRGTELTAVLLGFGLYFIRNFAQILGENGQIPVLLAAWAPPVASILLTAGLLLHAEDG